MQNDLLHTLSASGLLLEGDHVVCAVSGGADSMALLWALWLSRHRLSIRVSAAHFNHGLRGAESQRDAQFVRDFCRKNGIPLQVGQGDVPAWAAQHGQSIEQAARQLRYGFLSSLPHDKIATAHTANDNAETILLNLISGTGLRGLGGIPPVRGTIIRPFLSVTREEILAFLNQHQIPHMEDSTNQQDNARRNRIRHDLLPLILWENPAWLSTVQATARQLRQEDDILRQQAELHLQASRQDDGYRVSRLRAIPDGMRQRCLRLMLERQGASRPGHRHVQLLEQLIAGNQPSGMVSLCNGLCAQRQYDLLRFSSPEPLPFSPVAVVPEGVTRTAQWEIQCHPAERVVNTDRVFTVVPKGQIVARPRQQGDLLHLPGGSKSVKKLMIDRKIPRLLRNCLPVLEDEGGILAVYRLGADQQRIGLTGAVQITIQNLKEDEL